MIYELLKIGDVMKIEQGKSYDELHIGEHASFSKTITEADVYLFAGISGDFNPLHVNEEYARQTPLKPGLLTEPFPIACAGSGDETAGDGHRGRGNHLPLQGTNLFW
jgi:acyl dehydratase